MNRAKQVYTILFLYFYLPLILHYMHWKLRCAQLYISDYLLYFMWCYLWRFVNGCLFDKMVHYLLQFKITFTYVHCNK